MLQENSMFCLSESILSIVHFKITFVSKLNFVNTITLKVKSRHTKSMHKRNYEFFF